MLLLLLFFHEQLLFRKSRFVENTEIWSEILATKNTELQKIIRQLENGAAQPWMIDSAPVLWWHSKENFKATDPLITFKNSTLWYREVHPFFFFMTTTLFSLGPIGETYRAEQSVNGFSPDAQFSRLFESAGIKNGHAGFELHYDLYEFSAPPLLWRLSLSPLFREIQNNSPNEILVPIEYWYFMAHNPIPIYFGTHNGDWESFLILFKVSLKEKVLAVQVEAVYTSAHGGGRWRCEEELELHNGRLQLYSALNTHATYTRPGFHWRLYPDVTEKGLPWETWRNMRALTKESYYGFAGSWGRTSFIHWMNGPISPGPNFKFLPASEEKESRNQWKRFQESCGKK